MYTESIALDELFFRRKLTTIHLFTHKLGKKANNSSHKTVKLSSEMKPRASFGVFWFLIILKI